mgnify:FL=1
MDEITMNQIRMDKDIMQEQLEVIYMAQMKKAKKRVPLTRKDKDELVRSLESELEMVR